MMIRGLLICHGNLAAELAAASRLIMGDAVGVHAFSNTNLAPVALYQNIAEVLKAHPEDAFVAMVDLRGGNCWTVARMLSREFPDLKVVSGVNVPMVLSFLTKRETMEVAQLPETLLADALRGVQVD